MMTKPKKHPGSGSVPERAPVVAEGDRRAGAGYIGGEPVAWRTLVVQSDAADEEALVRGLRRHGHEVTTVRTGAATLRACPGADLVLFDLELPDLDGLALCRSIRTASDVPMIAVTDRGTELDRVLGLQAGADDYVVKPYGLRELLARVDAVLRRARPRPRQPRRISHGRLSIDARRRQVSLDGRQIDLTCKEFDLLHLLALEPETVVTRQRVMREVWAGSWSRRTVDTHVSSLRNKLGATSWVVTVRGVGFRLGSG